MVGLALLLGVADAGSSQGFGINRLQRLLAERSQADVQFTELRESRWLAAPLESSGTLRSSGSVLEKRVEHPRRETWRILADRIQVSVGGSGNFHEVQLNASSTAALLASTLRDVMAGRLDALDKDFRLDLAGDERSWTLLLTPRSGEVSSRLKEISLEGAGSRLLVIAVVESQGDRTTTKLRYE